MGELEQHTHMFVYGEKGNLFSVDSMRKAAILRLHRDGWTSSLHHHAYNQDCADFECEHFFTEADLDNADSNGKPPTPRPPSQDDKDKDYQS